MPAKIILIGDSGTGKTDSLITALRKGLNIRLLAAENNSAEVFKKALARHMIDVKAGKYPPLRENQVGIAIPDRPKKLLSDLLKQENDTIAKNLKTQMETADPKRKDYTRFIEILTSTSKFVDSLTGAEMGTADDWDENTVFAVDSLTIVCHAIKQHYVGGKLAITQPEWGIMQGRLMELIYMLTENLQCHFVLMAHPSKESDPNLGVTRIYPISLGQALNNTIPGAFTESVWCYRDEKSGYWWSTKDKLCVTRHTYMPCEEKIPQDYSLFLPPYNPDLEKSVV